MRLLLITLAACALLQCSRSVGSETSSSISPALPLGLKWHPSIARKVTNAHKFNPQAIVSEAFKKDSAGDYVHTDLDSLLASPVFEDYRGDIFSAASVAMGVSRGLFRHAATNANPRKLNTIGLTAFAFYDNPEHPHAHDALEMISTDRHTGEMSFHLVKFDRGKPVYEENPRICQGCHRERPIWQMYNFWPGMVHSESDTDSVRDFDPNDAIGFTVTLFEMNIARITRLLLDNEGYLPVENQVIAALLDCPADMFSFGDDPDYLQEVEAMKRRYYDEVEALITETNETNAVDNPIRRDENGDVRSRTFINRKDPIRLATVTRLLTGTGIDTETWSMSRTPRSKGILFQSSGGIGLSRLAYYLIHNSPNSQQLAELVPQSRRYTTGYNSVVPDKVCENLLED